MTVRYSSIAQAFHWLTAVLVLIGFIVSPEGREARIYSAGSEGDRILHESIGATILALVLLRLVWRLAHRPPVIAGQPAWMRLAAKAVHGLLYFLLIATPLTAVVGAWYEGHPVTFYLIGDIGPKLNLLHDLGARLSDLHGFLGDAIMWLAGLHAAAGLYHHFYLQDGVLATMVPGLKPPDTLS